MNPLEMRIAIGACLGIAGLVLIIINNRRSKSPKYQQMLEDFRQEVTDMLEPGEKLEASCGYKPCVAVSDKRFFVKDKKGLHAIPYSELGFAQGMSLSANKTCDPEEMFSVAVTHTESGKSYGFSNQSDGFEEVVAVINRKCGFI